MKMKGKRRLTIILSSLVVISALMIGMMALHLVSSRHRVREIEIRTHLRTSLLNLADRLAVEYERLCKEALSDALVRLSSLNTGDNPLPAIKALSMSHPVIRYPFLINGDGGYLFPFSRTRASSLLKAPERAAMDAEIGGLYKEGKKSEDRRDLIGAIRIYLKALARNRKPSLIPHLNAAVARSYLKMNRLPQAERYYTHALHSLRDPGTDDPDLFLIVARQLALIAHLEGNPEEALVRYLELFEKSVSLEPEPRGRRYEFFRNEAVDFIARHSFEMKSTPGISLPEPVERFMKTHVSRDASLQWLFFDLDRMEAESASSGTTESRQEELIRLSDLYSSDSEKNRFYRAVKNAPFWKGLNREKGQPFHRAVISTGKPFRLSMIRIAANRYFGFSVTDEFIRDHLLRNMGRKYIGDPALILRFDSASPAGSAASPANNVLLSVPVAPLGDSSRLFAISRSADYLGERIRREMVLNYFLISILILILFGGVLLWLRYIGRERELIRSKSDFLNLAAHTLKTPITRLSLLAENLRSGWVKDPETRNEFLDSIGNESRRMNELIENLLNFARIDEGKKRYVKKKVSLSEVLPAVLARHEPYLRSAGFSVETDIRPDMPPQWLDGEAMDMVVTGLLQNAVKYSGERKHIHVQLEREEMVAVLRISDRGIGIKAAEATKVFERFFRSESAAVRSVEGSGLGLFLVRHAVVAHGGTIAVSSEPGKGTVFTLRLPIPGIEESLSPKDGRQRWKRS